ncbi:MAG: ACT domain-containing protein [Micromonosporaceae bacterium]|nr:ACT domain-containing protein [Micromonosporaceae bacterium]
MHEYAITVIGRDRPGIIADVSSVLAGLGLNLTDSTMTRLRGHFAMTLVCAGQVPSTEVEPALAPLSAEGLIVSVSEVTTDGPPAPIGGHYVLRLYGADRLGIVAAVTRLLADVGGNITDLTTRLADGLYMLVAEVDLPTTVDIDGLAAQVRRLAADLNVEASLSPAETDVL